MQFEKNWNGKEFKRFLQTAHICVPDLLDIVHELQQKAAERKAAEQSNPTSGPTPAQACVTLPNPMHLSNSACP